MYLRVFIIRRTLVHQPQPSPKEVLDLIVMTGVDTFLILLREVGIVHAHRIYVAYFMIKVNTM